MPNSEKVPQEIASWSSLTESNGMGTWSRVSENQRKGIYKIVAEIRFPNIECYSLEPKQHIISLPKVTCDRPAATPWLIASASTYKRCVILQYKVWLWNTLYFHVNMFFYSTLEGVFSVSWCPITPPHRELIS